MTTDAAKFTGDIPASYDLRLGPVIFADFADEIAERAASFKPLRVLEIAAGTGIVTRKLRDKLGRDCELVATDLNPPMLEIARGKIAQDERVEFMQANAMELPFQDGEFDLVVCQFGVMFFPDKDKSYREVRRVLKPGGHYLFNVWDSFEHNSFARIAHETIGEFFASDKPTFYLTPTGYANLDRIKASLQAADFRDIAIQVRQLEKLILRARPFAEGLVLGNPSVTEITQRGNAPPQVVIGAVEAALHKQHGPDPMTISLQAIFVQARRP